MGSSNNAGAVAERRAREEQSRIDDGRARIDDVFRGFDNEFFQQVQQASLDVNLPQVNRQYEDQQDQLLGRLAEIGQLNGTTSAKRFGRLAGDRELALARANQLASGAERSARQNVEGERRTLVSQLQATADPNLAASSAAAASAALNQQQPLEEIGTLFDNATFGLGQTLQPQFDERGRNVGSPFSRFFAGSSTNGSRGSGSVSG